VNILFHNFDELNAVRADAQEEAIMDYGEISNKVAVMAAGQA
jgi:hypothetical protein